MKWIGDSDIKKKLLDSIYHRFKVNKLSLNEGKTKFTLFHKPRDKDNLPLQLPNLKINNNEIKDLHQ